MAKDPAFLFYSSDFLVGTMLMTDEQVGRYIKLLCLQHQKGHLTRDQMLSVCKEEDATVFDNFFTDKNGDFYNKRLDDEIKKRNKYTQSRRQNLASKGSKDKHHMVAHMESRKAAHMENENEDVNEDAIKDLKGFKEETFFDEFWKAYPKKKSKGQAEKAFKKINPDKQLLETMISTIDQAKKSADWKKESGQFVPYPATWLNAKGWMDEVGGTSESDLSRLKKKYQEATDEEE